MVTLNKLSLSLVAAYDRTSTPNHDQTVSVNPLVAEIATWYEKFRTAMDYREDEVILRSTIERILKRRLILGGSGESIAAPLIRELVWARYFPDSSIPESQVTKVAEAIDLYLKLEHKINRTHHINKGTVNEWILHLLSSEIEHILKPNDPKDIMGSFIFRIFKDLVSISDDTEEVRDLQVFIAVRRAYANDDLAFLRYHLFVQYFGVLSGENLDKIANHFLEAHKKIEEQFKYPAKDKIYTYVKNQTIPFLILDDVLRKHRGKALAAVSNEEYLSSEVLSACNSRYKATSGKVRRAIVRSVIFIFVTKAVFALFIEGAFERLLYGRTIWSSIAINVLTPPVLMIIVGFLIESPNRDNSYRILRKINTILYDDPPALATHLVVKKKPNKIDPLLWIVFALLWITTATLSFGAVVFILSKFGVNPFSQGVFIFFLAIVSFVSYRINRTAHMFIFKEKKENLGSLFFDFFFMPLIQIGRRLTLTISQLNIFLIIFDFIIETPFKGIFAFFEQWFSFLRSQREKLD
ncbi:MAG: hypothetical protein ACD_38C00009G0001 [uncultured bacterium]|uniref:Uncharacterized protein n=1 Tax=Candidatus Daviesbacteria bacterium RIFCSPHIGHO2_01_FULL_40_11 TaxID=1797762 RepID=A0A1F5JJD2_9BACT|nr:MAG: hypothetical protein ACD_38C00009G0001 [uncultured bacterium]OGE28757.1 MAG: hypothetical protein A2867_04730 [Candidatus Daviesbacteria bacterium RIFCSPHIGHO2_01_FULL_40_11]OGE62741.1 MAG: hypothetical protein A2964_00465 [Candidatus Daviesbacteria bacterium RIFCSPLOWO2_01_FULL_40_27]